MRTMKFLQCACIAGVVMVLFPPIERGPANVSEPAREPVRADEPVRVDNAQASVTVPKAAPIKLASLEDTHANPGAPFSPFAPTSPYPMRMSSPYERTTKPAETAT